MKRVEVVAGIIKYKDKILCTQRDVSKVEEVSFKWEFPGGKIEQGETHKEALIREIKEELNLIVSVGDLFMEVEYEYSSFQLVMYVYLCSCDDMNVNATVHKDYKWLSNDELDILDWAPADQPIVNKLKLQDNL